MASELLVQKFGGTSVAGVARVRKVALRVKQTIERGYKVVVVVSAMGDTTDKLITLAKSVTRCPDPRELDMLIANGESITAPLLAMALQDIGVCAISLSGAQAGIRTSRMHNKARIIDVNPIRIKQALSANCVPVVAGFQGVDDEFDVTTLGRGGSDTSAVALAAALGAKVCEIYTDVKGVYTADPRIVPEARLIPTISYEEMLELASVGAKVMHPRAVELGELYGIPIHVRSSFHKQEGTMIKHIPTTEERERVRGIAHEQGIAKITVVGVPDRPGIAAAIFKPLGDAGISVDVIIQNASREGVTDLSFTVSEADLDQAIKIVEEVAKNISAKEVIHDKHLAKVSIVGTGMLGTPGIAGTMFSTLAQRNINIEMISTSEIRITCIIKEHLVQEAVRALHAAFKLDQT